MPPELYGPTGLLVASLLTLGVLWREHLKNVEDLRKQRDLAFVQRDTAISGWRDQTGATQKLTEVVGELQEAVRQRSRDDAQRRRRVDSS